MPKTVPKELSNPELIYFPIAGKAEQVRLALHIAGIKFTDTRMNWNDFGEKKMSFPVGQLPVMKLSDDVMICQSQALLIYAGRKGGLMPADPENELLVNQLLCTTADIEGKCFPVFFHPDPEQKQEKMKLLLEEILPFWLDRLDKMIGNFGDGAGHCVGSTMTVADLNIYASLSWLCVKGGEHGIPKDLCDKYPNISKVVEVVDAHPKVKEWNAMSAAK